MKSSLATRKFDRIFNGNARSSFISDQCGDSSSPTKTCITKEVRWKVDKSMRQLLVKCGERLDEQLRQLQSIGLTMQKLLLGDETLHEVRAYYLEQVQQNGREANLREDQLDNFDLDKYCDPIVHQIERLRSFLSQSMHQENNNLPALDSIGGDEKNVLSRRRPNQSLNSNFQPQPMYELDCNWQFWFWRSDQRYLKWDFGLQKLGRSFRTVNGMHQVLHQLIDIHEVGKYGYVCTLLFVIYNLCIQLFPAITWCFGQTSNPNGKT